MIEIINGDCIEVLKKYPDNHFHSVVTDPPYGLGKEPNITEVMQSWIEHGYHEVKGSGFMGKHWDAFVPQPVVWKEIYRVLKPGGYMLVACGTRTQDWMCMSLRFAGFEVRDIITWHYGSGFPKSRNISKAIDDEAGAQRKETGEFKTRHGGGIGRSEKINQLNPEYTSTPITEPSTDEAKLWDGWGTALKPATEMFTLVRKPISEKTIADNVLKHGTGGLNIDACRISLDGEEPPSGSAKRVYASNSYNEEATYGENKVTPLDGRFPANVVFSHAEGCVCVGHKKVSGTFISNGDAEVGEASNGAVPPMRRGTGTDRTDENGLETVEEWICVDGCPIKELDEQSGVLKSGDNCIRTKEGSFVLHGGLGKAGDIQTTYGDRGGASRFFYVAKASTSERNKGLEGAFRRKPDHALAHGQAGTDNPYNRGATEVTNFHPTVKPIKLMRYLVTLITPPDGIVLDPFNGSGTTGIACKQEGFNYIGIEMEKEYCDISRARIDAWRREDEQLSLF